MAQPGKRKPSLVWEFFEKLDDGSGKCISGGIFFCGISGGIFFGGISGGIFAVFLVFLQYRYGTETTVCHVSNTEYRYCIKIGYTATHWGEDTMGGPPGRFLPPQAASSPPKVAFFEPPTNPYEPFFNPRTIYGQMEEKK